MRFVIWALPYLPGLSWAKAFCRWVRMMLEGSIVDGTHRLELRVHYEDTDFSGFVYHANYLKLCERGRSDFLRVLGLDQKAMMAADGLMFVVRRMVCDFLKPARFDDVLSIETRPIAQAGARHWAGQAIRRCSARSPPMPWRMRALPNPGCRARCCCRAWDRGGSSRRWHSAASPP